MFAVPTRSLLPIRFSLANARSCWVLYPTVGHAQPRVPLQVPAEALLSHDWPDELQRLLLLGWLRLSGW